MNRFLLTGEAQLSTSSRVRSQDSRAEEASIFAEPSLSAIGLGLFCARVCSNTRLVLGDTEASRGRTGELRAWKWTLPVIPPL